MTEHEKTIIRAALLAAESEWLNSAETAETPTSRTIAVVIADAFHQESKKYDRSIREKTDELGWAADDFDLTATHEL